MCFLFGLKVKGLGKIFSYASVKCESQSAVFKRFIDTQTKTCCFSASKTDFLKSLKIEVNAQSSPKQVTSILWTLPDKSVSVHSKRIL